MSSIERAMRRAAGEPEPQQESPAQTENDEAGAIASEGQPADAVEAAPPETARVAADDAAAPPPPTNKGAVLDLDWLRSGGFIVPGEPANQLSEEFQGLKRRLLGNMVEGMLPVGSNSASNLIMVTSSIPGEGKTFTSVNLALSIASEIDRHVLVVDTDIIKADMSRIFGVNSELGLFDLLGTRADIDISQAIQCTNIPTLSVIPAGTDHRAISEKLASETMRRLAEELATRYRDRVVVFDCPPVLATTGAVALAPVVGQIVMVVEAAKSTRDTVLQGLAALEPNRVTGMVLNKSRQSHSSRDYYYYGYYKNR